MVHIQMFPHKQIQVPTETVPMDTYYLNKQSKMEKNEDGIGVLFQKRRLSLLGLLWLESDAFPVLTGSACAS